MILRDMVWITATMFFLSSAISQAGAAESISEVEETTTVHKLDGREIMRKVEGYLRETSDSAFHRMRLSTCRFGVDDNRITCAERPRVKSIESISKNYGPTGLDSRSVNIVLEPADERGIGLLIYNYDDANRQNESWIYLSALGRVKRIASSNSDDESEAASVFGSEFTTEDMSTGKLDQYAINLLEESIVRNREVWVIEMIPNEQRARETRYGRTVSYIDKERYVSLRSDYYDHFGDAIKRLMSSKIELLDDIWMARSLTMMNLVTNRLSNMAFVEVYTGIDVDDEILSQRTLTDVAFREARLQAIRAQID
ncbi:MAG: outer membrane lipoprotein-sorting protein [Gammaproteobacteria bacterium]|nr:outer membrane lipoprotein-sorting protein [Gammaproteobacteria bacterium]MCY4357251.1 outer membrane lipoprotein-sorting protein [Gammaproteobacteria bacterium]